MTIIPARFGTDIRLLNNIEYQEQRLRGADLRTETRSRELEATEDLEAIEGVANLQQALLLRFLTPVGEMEILGHPDYGSRLHELIGELNTQTNRDRAKLYALQALLAEPRIKEVTSLAVSTRRDHPSHVDIVAKLAVLDEDSALNFVFPFVFEGGTS